MSDDEVRAKIAGLPPVTLTLKGTWEPAPIPMTYITPRRDGRWRRWQVVEYSGLVTDLGGGQFQGAGPLDRTLHSRRFWFYRSAKRYIDRYLASRKDTQA